MPKIKSIARYATTYSRASVYDDSVIEKKNPLSFLGMDDRGNVTEDKTFDGEGNVENFIKRKFTGDTLLEESFFDGFEDQAYETRLFAYDENEILCSSKIKYTEDEIEQRYIYSKVGKLIQKTVVYSDGTSYVENEYEWEGDNLIKAAEYDEGDPVFVKEMTYNEQGQIIELSTEEFINKDYQTEAYAYAGDKLIKQTTFNYRGDVMLTVENRYEGELLMEKTTETGTQFFRHRYTYDEHGRKIRESILNRDDLVLTDYVTAYDADGLELNTKTYSLNIVDEEKDLILIEQHTTEYSFHE